MMTFEIFQPKCLCIILDVAGVRPARDGRSAYPYVKSGIVQGLSTLQDDDLVYVYRADGELTMGRTISESVSIVSDWQHKKFSIPMAIEESIVLTSQYDGTRRGVFYVTDNYKLTNDGLLRDSIRDEVNSDSNCLIFVYGIGKSYSQTLRHLGDGLSSHYNFTHLDDYSELGQNFVKDLKKI